MPPALASARGKNGGLPCPAVQAGGWLGLPKRRTRAQVLALGLSRCVPWGTHLPSDPSSLPSPHRTAVSWTKGGHAAEGSTWQRACSTGGHGPAPPPQPTPPGTLTFRGFVHRVPELEACRVLVPQFLQLGPQQDVLLGLGGGQGPAVRRDSGRDCP